MMRRPWLLVLLVLVLGVGGGALTALLVDTDDAPGVADGPAPSPTPGPPTSGQTDTGPGVVPKGLEAFYEQTLDWTGCAGSGHECATLTVPVDYAKPEGDTVGLHLERVPAEDQGARVGSLVVNPGGPGAPGTTLLDSPSFAFGEPLLQRMDIVAFDPRGTGESDPVDCISDSELDAYTAEDPSPDDQAEIDELVQAQQAFWDGCVANSDDLVGHVSTVEAARDMDVLRGALREPKLAYLGFSYGTTLGSTYASLFPGNVGRFVLDGATDPSLDFREGALSQAKGFQTALDAYVDDCLAGGDCFLGDSREAGLATISGLLDQVDDAPLPTSSGRELQIGNAFYGIAAPLYSRDTWSYLDQGLQQALDGSGDVLLALSDLYSSRNPDGSYADNSSEAFLSISCLDDPSAITPDQVPDELPAFEEASPTFGDIFAWGLVGCGGIQVQAEEPEPTIRAEGADPILVLGTTRDPATPYAEAVALADQLASGVLVSRDGDGHTAYNKGNACVDDAVEGYLLEGAVPDDGLEC